jgi:chemotaxis protein methyltransferase CheR
MLNRNNLKYQEYWEVIAENTGYDFSGYSADSLNQRLEKFISYERIGSAEELRNRFNSDRLSQERLVGKLLTCNTEFFRDSAFFAALRKKVLMHLSTYPEINIWIAGCSTGEEVFSVAILMEELRLLSRCNFIATDVNQPSLDVADRAIYSLQKAKACSMRYFNAGGHLKFSNYYTAYYDQIVISERLRARVKFIRHDITEDPAPLNNHLVLFRNVMCYFNERIQAKVLKSVSGSLLLSGFMAVGIDEIIPGNEDLNLACTDPKNKIYRKI